MYYQFLMTTLRNKLTIDILHLSLQDPAKPLFILPNNEILHYGTFETFIGQYSSCLRQMGVKKGDRVAAQVSKTPENIALYLATLQIGAIYIPLNTDYKLEEIRFFLTNSDPAVFVCREECKSYYSCLETMKIIDENELCVWAKKCIAEMTIEQVSSDDVAAICYTSGTTGKPKGAMITHGNLTSNAESLCKIWKFSRNDILLHALPIYHAHGLFVALNTVFMKGCSVTFLPKFEVELVCYWLPKCTLMMGVPTYYTRLLQNQKFEKNLVKSVRVFISGSAPLLESTWLEFRKRTGHEILERYGMTEGQMICSNPYDGPRRPGECCRFSFVHLFLQ